MKSADNYAFTHITTLSAMLLFTRVKLLQHVLTIAGQLLHPTLWQRRHWGDCAPDPEKDDDRPSYEEVHPNGPGKGGAATEPAEVHSQ